MEKPAPQKTFWSRQFSPVRTREQLIFDVLFGAIVPILLFILDPTVFRSTSCPGPLLAKYGLLTYLGSGLGILTLLTWLLGKRLRESAPAFFAGILLTGALFALAIGVSIFPYSVIGLIQVIGALGFLPFFTSFVYFRNGMRALRTTSSVPTNRTLLLAALLAGVIFVIGIPAVTATLVSDAVQHEVDSIVKNSDPAAINNLKQMNSVCKALCTPTLFTAFDRAATDHADRKEELSTIYKQITAEQLVYFWYCNSSD